MYKYFLKRLFDFLIALIGIVILSPFFLLFTPIVAIAMGGNPFFIQYRPGKKGKIFKLIKYRSMTNKKDKDGNLLPDEVRLTKFGKFMRKTSLDELPELFNILKGDMAIIGPRPLLVKYLTLYSEEQMHRHDVRPGLTGWAQVNGRNDTTWEKRFKYDLEYVKKVNIFLDIKIFFMTIGKVFKRSGISQNGEATMEEFKGNEEVNETKEG